MPMGRIFHVRIHIVIQGIIRFGIIPLGLLFLFSTPPPLSLGLPAGSGWLRCDLGDVLIVELCLGRWSPLGRLMGVEPVSFLYHMITGSRSMLFIRSRVVVPWMR